jgi:hypothetical protein
MHVLFYICTLARHGPIVDELGGGTTLIPLSFKEKERKIKEGGGEGGGER